jgi:hypothetical protein
MLAPPDFHHILAHYAAILVASINLQSKVGRIVRLFGLSEHLAHEVRSRFQQRLSSGKQCSDSLLAFLKNSPSDKLHKHCDKCNLPLRQFMTSEKYKTYHQKQRLKSPPPRNKMPSLPNNSFPGDGSDNLRKAVVTSAVVHIIGDLNSQTSSRASMLQERKARNLIETCTPLLPRLYDAMSQPTRRLCVWTVIWSADITLKLTSVTVAYAVFHRWKEKVQSISQSKAVTYEPLPTGST